MMWRSRNSQEKAWQPNKKTIKQDWKWHETQRKIKGTKLEQRERQIWSQ
jgi:hypothetical protein